MTTIDVLMTCHNRRGKTLACLDMVVAQTIDADVRVILVDADSQDGTAAEVAVRFPWVTVVPVGSDVFWGQGMQMAGRSARQEADYHLWLNDDVVLRSTSFEELVRWGAPDRVVVGKLTDADGEPTYGGLAARRMARLSLQPVPAASVPARVDTMNGNVVLVGRAVREELGPVRGDLFPHAFGDIDYGFNAGRAGYVVLQAPGVLGECSLNPPSPSRSLPTLSARWRAVTSTKELPPRVWWRACWRHGGAMAPVYFLLPYLKLLRRQQAAP